MKGGRLILRGLIIVGLVEKEVGCQLLVLVASKVSLNSGVAIEAQAA